MPKEIQVGFSQRIQLDWLERAATLALIGQSYSQAETTLLDFLTDKLSVGSQTKRGNRHKATTILLKIWLTAPLPQQPFQKNGLELLRTSNQATHLPLHWGMSMVTYPFFGAIAATIGRLFHLQQTITIAQVHQRIQEQYGQRQTVTRATQRVVRCFTDWGVLQETGTLGHYQARPKQPLDNPEMAVWLMEAVLRATQTDSQPLQTLLQAPQLFPFSLTMPPQNVIEANGRLEYFRQGVTMEMVALH